MGKSRELIIELIGEEKARRYYRGQRIEIKAPHHTYGIERGRGYANIIRSRESYDEIKSYPLARPLTDQQKRDYYTRFRGVIITDTEVRIPYSYTSRTSTGTIRSWNIDDAVASFIVAAKVGKVNWGCGNLDVRLPSSMPPRDLGFLEFISLKVRTSVNALNQGLLILNQVPAIIMEIHDDLIKGDGDNQLIISVCALFILIPGALVMVIELGSGLKGGPLLGPCLLSTTTLSVGYYIFLSYRRWQRKWRR